MNIHALHLVFFAEKLAGERTRSTRLRGAALGNGDNVAAGAKRLVASALHGNDLDRIVTFPCLPVDRDMSEKKHLATNARGERRKKEK
jgi:hypothetical protein